MAFSSSLKENLRDFICFALFTNPSHFFFVLLKPLIINASNLEKPIMTSSASEQTLSRKLLTLGGSFSFLRKEKKNPCLDSSRKSECPNEQTSKNFIEISRLIFQLVAS